MRTITQITRKGPRTSNSVPRHSYRKTFDRGLIRLAHVNEHETAVTEALSNLLRCQIPHLRILLSHSYYSPALMVIELT
jgi:hypothetical protein